MFDLKEVIFLVIFIAIILIPVILATLKKRNKSGD